MPPRRRKLKALRYALVDPKGKLVLACGSIYQCIAEFVQMRGSVILSIPDYERWYGVMEREKWGIVPIEAFLTVTGERIKIKSWHNGKPKV